MPWALLEVALIFMTLYYLSIVDTIRNEFDNKLDRSVDVAIEIRIRLSKD